MKFKVIQNGRELECNILFTFKDDSNGISYVVYTDDTVDTNNKHFVYASRYVLEGNDYILENIVDDYEWDLIDKMLDLMYKGIDN